MELHVVLRRLADRRLALVQPAELRADVGGAGAIAILWEPTLFVLANAQPPNPAAHRGLHLLPRTARVETLAARLARVLLWRQGDDESLRQLVHGGRAQIRRGSGDGRGRTD